MPFNMGPWELGIVLVIIMIIFGAGKLPEVAKSLGQGVKEFKKEASAPVDSTLPPSTTATSERRDEAKVVDSGQMRAEEI